MKHLFIGIATKCCFLIAMFMLIQLYGNAQFLIAPPSTQTGTTSAGPITVHTSAGPGVYVGHGNFNNASCTAVGSGALATATSGNGNNTAVGFNALSSPVFGNGNTAVGGSAMLNSSGNAQANTGIGFGALQTNTGGSRNTAVGASALVFSSGTDNTAVGSNGALNLAFGNFNTFIGSNSGFSGTVAATMTGSSNVAVGNSSLNGLINGSNNTAIGPSALDQLQNGSGNVAIGFQARANGGGIGTFNNTLSIQNVIFGSNMAPFAGNIGIGVLPVATAGGSLSKLHLAGGAPTTPSLQLDYVPNVTNPGVRYLYVDADGIVNQSAVPTGVTHCGNVNFIPVTNNINGNMTCSQIFDNGASVGISQIGGFGFTAGLATTLTPGSPGAPIPTNFRLGVNGWVSATAYTSLSDQRIKKDIKKIENPLDKISKISGYTYYWNKDYKTERKLDNNKQAGFLAQEILKVLPEAVIKSEDGLYGLNYNAIMPLLAEGIKEQQSQIEKQQIKIEDLEAKVKELSNKLDRLVPGEVKIKEANFDIRPNPITGISTVSYKLDNANTNAYLAVYDLQGKLLKQISLAKNTNAGQVQIRKTDFTNGMYILALISNNVEIQSKRFIISQ